MDDGKQEVFWLGKFGAGVKKLLGFRFCRRFMGFWLGIIIILPLLHEIFVCLAFFISGINFFNVSVHEFLLGNFGYVAFDFVFLAVDAILR